MCALSCAYDSYSCFCCGNHHQHFLNNKPKASLLGASLDYLDWFSALLLLLGLDNVKHLGNASGYKDSFHQSAQEILFLKLFCWLQVWL